MRECAFNRLGSRVAVRHGLLLLIGLTLASTAAWAQIGWSTDGNHLLDGTFRFREVTALTDIDGSDELLEVSAHTGTIVFDGEGNYTINGTLWTSSGDRTVPTSISGSYRIAESGYGFLERDVDLLGGIFGLVSGDVFIGSSTEDVTNTLFVAVRAADTVQEMFSGQYQAAYMSFPVRDLLAHLSDYRDAWFNLAPNGAGGLATMNVEGFIGRDYSPAEQMIGAAKYSFTDGVGTLNLQGIVTGMQLINGMKEFYVSPDRSFVFGGSPTDADFFVAIRKPADGVGPGALSGTYFGAGLEIERSEPDPVPPALDSYYGAFTVNNGTLIGHQRLLPAPEAFAYDFAWNEELAVPASGVVDDTFLYRHQVSPDGRYRIGFGRGDFIGLWAAVAVTLATPVDGPFINPIGVLNAGSFVPFTAGLARGTVVTIFGSNFASNLLVDGNFPYSLGGIVVRVNGQDVRVYVVAPNQISFVLPYGLGGVIAEIEVIRNGQASNRVTAWLNNTSPGVFTIPPNGIGYAAALHADFKLVTPENPALPGETIQVYLTGLGNVDPAVVAGDPGPANPLSRTTEDFIVFVGDDEAATEYAGLAPFLGGLYQLNITISPNQPPGDWILFIGGSDSFVGQALVPVGSGASEASLAPRKAEGKSRRKLVRGVSGAPPR